MLRAATYLVMCILLGIVAMIGIAVIGVGLAEVLSWL